MRESIGRRLFLIFTGLAILPLLLTGTVIGLQSLLVQQRQVTAMQRQVAEGVSLRVRSVIQDIEGNLEATVRVLELMKLPLDQQIDVLDRILLNQPDIAAISLIDEQGQEVARASAVRTMTVGELRDMSQTREFVVPKSSRETYYGPVRLDGALDEPVMTIALPLVGVYDGEKVEGVLVATIRLKSLWDLLATLPVSDYENIFVVDSEGWIFAHRDPTVVLNGTRYELPAGEGDVATGLDGELSFRTVRRVTLGDQVVYVVTEQPIRVALQAAFRMELLGFSIVIVVAAAAFFLWHRATRSIVVPIEQMAEVARSVSEGDLTVQVDVESDDEIGALAESLNVMTTQLRELIGTLEQRVADQTRGLQAAADVARATTSVLDPDELMRQVVDLVRERFGLYYVGLFLLDEERRYAVLRAGTGEAGRKMLEQGHRLEVGGDSMIGQCVALAEARVAMDVSEEDKHFDNPLLPDTHSELALPLRSRGRVVGAMTVQSTEMAAFDEADIAALQTMADLVAVAIDNARLFVETQDALREMESIQRRYLGQAWAEYTQIRDISGYRNIAGEMIPLTEEVLPQVKRVLEEQRVVTVTPEEVETGEMSELVVPIKLRDLTIGAIGFRRQRKWSPDDVALAESLAEQLALAADNLRLLDETQRNAARERLTREITARMRETLDVDYVLRTAVRGMREALGLLEAEAWIEISSGDGDESGD